MLRNKMFPLVVMFLLLILIMAACGGKETTQSNDSGSSQSGTNDKNDNANTNEEVITLKLADFFPTTHYLSVQGSVFFMKRAEELTNGKVKFEYFPSEQLAAAKDLFDATKNNVTDIGQVQVGYVADKIPLSGVAEIPGSFDSTIDGANAYWELLDKLIYEQELKKNNFKPLFTVVLPPYQLLTVDGPVKTVEDINGLMIRAGGGAQSLLATELGGTPVSMTGPEVYSALDRGVIDSVLFPLTSVQNYSLQEIAKYSTVGLNFGSTAHIWGINENVWSKLPEDIQKALLEAGQETTANLTKFQENEISKSIEELKSQGVQFTELDSEQKAKIQSSANAVWEDWVSKLKDRGLPAEEVKNKFLESLKK